MHENQMSMGSGIINAAVMSDQETQYFRNHSIIIDYNWIRSARRAHNSKDLIDMTNRLDSLWATGLRIL